jgi:hypothetical protein
VEYIVTFTLVVTGTAAVSFGWCGDDVELAPAARGVVGGQPPPCKMILSCYSWKLYKICGASLSFVPAKNYTSRFTFVLDT